MSLPGASIGAREAEEARKWRHGGGRQWMTDIEGEEARWEGGHSLQRHPPPASTEARR